MLRWRWSRVSVSVWSWLRAALALLVVGNMAFVIAQVSVTLLGGSLVNVLGLGKGWEPLWYLWAMVMLLLEQLVVRKVWVATVGEMWDPPEVTNLVVFDLSKPGLMHPAVGVLGLCGVALQAFASALSCRRLINSLGLWWSKSQNLWVVWELGFANWAKQ